jgi:hypothetical protein
MQTSTKSDYECKRSKRLGQSTTNAEYRIDVGCREKVLKDTNLTEQNTSRNGANEQCIDKDLLAQLTWPFNLGSDLVELGQVPCSPTRMRLLHQW